MGVQLVVAGGHRAGQVIPIATEKFIIGRAVDCHLKPTSELISRYHCAILVGADVIVRDLGSRNGVRLNGEKITTEQKVNCGDKLGIGPLEFFVHITGDERDGLPEDQNVSWGHLSGDMETRAGEHSPTVSMPHSAVTNQERE